MPATTPEPPYYAVIFTTTVTGDMDAYHETALEIERLAAQQSGYLGIESSRDATEGITVSYWTDEEAIAAWKANVDHAAARECGRERWYATYELRVARVERAYRWSRSDEVRGAGAGG